MSLLDWNGVAAWCMSVHPVEHRAVEQQEAGSAPRDCHDQDADVEGHERQHEEVGEPDAEGVDGRLEEGGKKARLLPPETSDAAAREQLHEERHEEDHDQSEPVHAAARAWPHLEEDFGVRSPEEGHVGVPLLHLRRVPVPTSQFSLLSSASSSDLSASLPSLRDRNHSAVTLIFWS